MRTIACLGAMMAASAAFADTYTWNGAGGAAWTTGENWLVGETPSAWTDGASASFGAGASVLLPSSVAVSNLTTAGALAISGSDSTNPAFLSSSTPTLVFPGLTLDDIDGSILAADMAGYALGGTLRAAKAYHYVRNGATATAQFQLTHSGHLRCHKVTFTEGADGIYAQVGNKSYYVHNNDSGALKLGEDIDSDPKTIAWNVGTSLNGDGLSICNLRGALRRVKAGGDVQLGGAMALTNAAIEITKPGSKTWNYTLSGLDDCLSVKGLSDATVEKTFGITTSGMGAGAAWLTTTATDHVFTNMVLPGLLSWEARWEALRSEFVHLPPRTMFHSTETR